MEVFILALLDLYKMLQATGIRQNIFLHFSLYERRSYSMFGVFIKAH